MEILTGLTMMTSIDLLALAAIVVIGLPHGALDGAIAIHLGFSRNALQMAGFLLAYVAAAGVVVGAWLFFPFASLLIFLLISMMHFGSGDVRAERGWQRRVGSAAHGGLVVVGISQMHRGEVDHIFEYLVLGDTTLIWQALDILTIFIGMAMLFYLFQAVRLRRWRAGVLEMVLLTAIFALTPPLVGFAIYFCVVHSFRHVSGVLGTLRASMSWVALINQAAFFTIASWVAGALAIWYLTDDANLEPVLLRVVFIGLAALTVPHMILVDGLFNRTRHSLRRDFISR